GRLRGALGGEVATRRVHEARDLELAVQLGRAIRRPDRVTRAADLRDIREVEDGQAVPGLGHRLAAAFPSRPDMALERVEVAQARRAQHGRPEDEVATLEDGIVILVSWRELLGELRERLNAQTARQVVVERGDRLAEEDGVVGPPR